MCGGGGGGAGGGGGGGVVEHNYIHTYIHTALQNNDSCSFSPLSPPLPSVSPPPSLTVTLDYTLWCWEAETVTVVITTDQIPTLQFVQRGYAMQYSASHDVTVLVSGAI